MNRFFFRCGRCLFRFTADHDSFRAPDVRACPICAREYVECLGATKGVLSVGVKCNEVCVFAEGPDCSCSCGGANHGSRLLIPVLKGVVDFNSGKFPPLEKARVAWEKWLAELAAAKGLAGDNASAQHAISVSMQEFYASKSWENRRKALTALCKRLGLSAPPAAGGGAGCVTVQNSLAPMSRPGDLFAWGEAWKDVSPQFRGHRFEVPTFGRGAPGVEVVRFSPVVPLEGGDR